MKQHLRNLCNRWIVFAFLFPLPAVAQVTITGTFKAPTGQTPSAAGIESRTINSVAVCGDIQFQLYDSAGRRPVRVVYGGVTYFPQPVAAWIRCSDGALMNAGATAASVSLIPNVNATPTGTVWRLTGKLWASTLGVAEGGVPETRYDENKSVPESNSDWGALSVAAISVPAFSYQQQSAGTVSDYENFTAYAAASVGTPAAGSVRLFFDSSNSNKLTRRNSDGTLTVIEGTAITAREVDLSPSITALTIEMAQATGIVGTDQGSNVFRISLQNVPDSVLSQLTTAGKVHGTAITGLASLPAGAGVIPTANLPATMPPAAHASSHQNGGADEVATATPGANAIPKAGAGSELAAGWLPLALSGTRGALQLTGALAGTAASPELAAGVAGAGIALDTSSNPDRLQTASNEENFLISGALTCGAGTRGKMQVHTTALQYCDNSGTPTLRYAAYGNSDGSITEILNLAGLTDVSGTSGNGSTVPLGTFAGLGGSHYMGWDGANWINRAVAFSEITGAVTDAQVPNNITIDLAATATALAANPADCASDRYAIAIDALGVLTCAQVSLSAGVTGTLPVANGGTGTASTLTGLVRGHASAMTAAELSGVVNTSGSNATTPGKADVMQTSLYCLDAGSNDTYACNLSPAVTAYVTGTQYRFKANTANTGAATINFNSVGALTIVKVTGGITTALADNDIRAGAWVTCVYDGTNCQMSNMLGNAAAAGASALDDLTDVATAGQAAGDVLCNTDGTNWEPCTPTTPVNAQTGTSYTVLSSDRGKLVTHTNGSAIAVTLPACGGAGFEAGWWVDVQNRGAGTVTITPTTSTLDGAASLTLVTEDGTRIACGADNNYFTQRGRLRTHTHASSAQGGQITDAALSAAVGIAKGGTGQTTATAAFDALAPTTTRGDMIRRGASANERVALGASGRYWKSDGTDAVWSSGSASGTGTCTNQFARALNSDAAPTCATVSLTADVTGSLPVANGGTAGTTAATARSGLGVRYGISVGNAVNASPAQNSTYYSGFGTFDGTAGDNTRHYVVVPVAGTITRACVMVHIAGTLGTAEDVTFRIRKNKTTDSTETGTQDWDAAERGPTCWNLTTAFTVAADDYITLKISTPVTWATAPTNVVVRWSVSILQDQ